MGQLGNQCSNQSLQLGNQFSNQLLQRGNQCHNQRRVKVAVLSMCLGCASVQAERGDYPNCWKMLGNPERWIVWSEFVDLHACSKTHAQIFCKCWRCLEILRQRTN